MINITKEELKIKYLDEDLTMDQIADFYQVDIKLIRKLVKKFYLSKNNTYGPIEKDWLYERYITNKLSLKKISLETGIPRKTLEYWAGRYDISKRRKITVTEEEIVRDYLNGDGSTTIAKRYGVSVGYALKRLWKNDIEIRDTDISSNNKQKAGIARRKNYEDISSSYWSSLKYMAADRKLEFSITREYVWELFIKQNKRCALSGEEITLIPFNQYGIRKKKDQTASLDRINSKLGYIEGNVQWVHKAVNMMKWNLEESEFYKWSKKVFHNLKERYEINND